MTSLSSSLYGHFLGPTSMLQQKNSFLEIQVSQCITKNPSTMYVPGEDMRGPCHHGKGHWLLSILWLSYHDPVPFKRIHLGQ